MTRLASGIFVTGTDTGVGKTTISTVLIEALVAQGKKVAVMKPVESGCAPIRDGDKVAHKKPRHGERQAVRG